MSVTVQKQKKQNISIYYAIIYYKNYLRFILNL